METAHLNFSLSRYTIWQVKDYLDKQPSERKLLRAEVGKAGHAR